MSRRSTSLGVDWHLPNPARPGTYKARPFATTTPASGTLIELLAVGGATWGQMAEQINFDAEAKAVALGFIEAGYGHVAALSHLRPLADQPTTSLEERAS